MPGLHEDEEEEDECRICRDISQPDAPLITPCACRGSLAFVHSRCLLHWLKVSHGAALHGRPLCTVCQQPFRFRAPGLASYIIERPSWRPHGLAQWLGRTAARFCRHLLHDASCGHVECLTMRWAIALAALQLSLWEGQMILILSWGFIRDALSLDRALDEILVPPQLQPLLRSIMPSPLEVSEFAIGFPDGHSDPTQRATSRSAAAAAATRASCIATPTGSGAHPFVGPDSALHTGSSRSFWVQLLMPAGSTEAAAHVQAAVLGMGALRSGGSRAHGAGTGMPPGQPGRLGHRPWTSAWSAMCRLGVRWADASHSVLRALLPVTFRRPASSRTAHPSPAHSTPPNDPRSDISPWVFGELDGALQSAGRALYSLLLEPFLIAAAVRCARLPLAQRSRLEGWVTSLAPRPQSLPLHILPVSLSLTTPAFQDVCSASCTLSTATAWPLPAPFDRCGWFLCGKSTPTRSSCASSCSKPSSGCAAPSRECRCGGSRPWPRCCSLRSPRPPTVYAPAQSASSRADTWAGSSSHGDTRARSAFHPVACRWRPARPASSAPPSLTPKAGWFP